MKVSKTVLSLNAEIDARANVHTEALAAITESEVSNVEVSADAERNAKRHLHHIRKLEGLRKLDTAKSAARALSVLASFRRNASGNDIEKAGRMSDAVAHADPERLTNAGMYNALLMLDKLTRKHTDKETFSWTDFATVGTVKANNRTSLTMLDKLGILKQEKEGRTIVAYSVADREALNGLLNIFA